MIKFTLRVKNLPPEAVEWFGSSGFEFEGRTHTVKPIGGLRPIAPKEKYTWEFTEERVTYPTFIYVRAFDAMGNMLTPPLAPPRQYWEVKSGAFIYDWETTEVTTYIPWKPIALIGAFVGAIMIVAKKRQE